MHKIERAWTFREQQTLYEDYAQHAWDVIERVAERDSLEDVILTALFYRGRLDLIVWLGNNPARLGHIKSLWLDVCEADLDRLIHALDGRDMRKKKKTNRSFWNLLTGG